MTIGFMLVGTVLAILIVTGTMKLPGAAVKAAGGVVALLVLLASCALSSFRLVGENQIGVVSRNIGGGSLAPGKIIATEGEIGPADWPCPWTALACTSRQTKRREKCMRWIPGRAP